jgi:hypothetical protein
VTGGREGKVRFEILFAGERCSRAVLDFLATTDVRRRISDPAEENAQCETSELALWER